MKKSASAKPDIAIIGIVGLPACYGGFESFAEQLVLRLQQEFEITVYCSKRAFTSHPPTFDKVRLKYLPLNANGVQSVPYDMVSILHSLSFADSLLILGVGGCPLLPLLRLFGCRKNIVVNIDGIEWRRAKWSGLAKWYLRFAEKCAVKYADAVVGDNQVIVDYVRDTYQRDCHLIEYGADHQKKEQS